MMGHLKHFLDADTAREVCEVTSMRHDLKSCEQQLLQWK